MGWRDEQRLEGVRELAKQVMGEEYSREKQQQCKGPGARTHVLRLRSSEGAEVRGNAAARSRRARLLGLDFSFYPA